MGNYGEDTVPYCKRGLINNQYSSLSTELWENTLFKEGYKRNSVSTLPGKITFPSTVPLQKYLPS